MAQDLHGAASSGDVVLLKELLEAGGKQARTWGEGGGAWGVEAGGQLEVLGWGWGVLGRRAGLGNGSSGSTAAILRMEDVGDLISGILHAEDGSC